MKSIIHLPIIFLFFTSQSFAEWKFNLHDEIGVLVQSNRLLFPITFSQIDCEFTFKIIGDDGQIKNSSIIHNNGCSSNHRLLLDEYWYEYDDGFTFIFEPGQWTSFGSIDLGKCVATDGSNIPTGTPFLFIQSRIIQIDDDKDISYFTLDGISYISLKTAHENVKCANGTFFEQGSDLIFKDGFEIK